MRATKDPDAVEDFGFDWSDRLKGDTVIASNWFLPATTDGLAVDRSSFTATTATVWLSGGTHGNTHYLTNQVQTAAGRTHDWTLVLTLEHS